MGEGVCFWKTACNRAACLFIQKGTRRFQGTAGLCRRKLGAFAYFFSGAIVTRTVSPDCPGKLVNIASIRRSEEHTSELQSLMRISYAVFCLNKKNKPDHIYNPTKHNNK